MEEVRALRENELLIARGECIKSVCGVEIPCEQRRSLYHRRPNVFDLFEFPENDEIHNSASAYMQGVPGRIYAHIAGRPA